VLVIRAIWEIHWTLMALFVGVGLVCFMMAGWVWPTPGASRTSVGHRVAYSCGGLLSLGFALFFVWAARSDQLTLDRGQNRWRMTRRTFPWDCRSCDGRSEEGEVSGIATAFVTSKQRKEIERMTDADVDALVASQTLPATQQQQQSDTTTTTTEKPNSSTAGSSDNEHKSLLAVTPSSSTRRDVNGNRSCACNCGTLTLCLRLRSGRVVTTVDGFAWSWTAMCSCEREKCGFVDVDSTRDLLLHFLQDGTPAAKP